MKNKIEKEIIKVFKFLRQKEQGHDKYGNNGFIILSGKKYFIGCMSYREWYLEPYKKDKTERDDFNPNTLWEKTDILEIIQLFIDNDLLDLKIKEITNKND